MNAPADPGRATPVTTPPRAYGRIFAWSDLHVDFGANRSAVTQLSQQDFREDLLLLAGDVSSSSDQLLATLEALRDRFAEVAFVPGNHDLWVSATEPPDSLTKLHALRTRCREAGIRVEPFAGMQGRQRIHFVPLLSWYVRPEEGAGSLFLPKPGEDPDLRMWADNFRIKWPPLPGGLTPGAHLLSLNLPALEPVPEAGLTITFSHFVPRVELVFADWERFVREGAASGDDRAPEFNFTRVAGCRQLDELLRRQGSRLHVYGHQHRNRDREIDGVRYLSHCLGYPGESREAAGQPDRRLPREIRLNG